MTTNQTFQWKSKEAVKQYVAYALGLLIFAILFKAFKEHVDALYLLKGFEGIMKVIRIVHIVAGCFCLGFGLAAILTKKGGKVHRNNGKIYFWNMFIIFVSGIMMAIYHNQIFFFFIAFVSFYPAFIGYRILYQKQLSEGQQVKWYDYALLALIAFVAATGIYLGVVNINSSLGILLLIFNTLLLNHFRTTFIFYRKKAELKGFWLILHITEMSGSYVAAITAFLVNNSKYFDFIPNIILWISPGIIGGIIIGIVARKYKRKMLVGTN